MRTHHTIQQSIDYIEAHLEESLSLEEIASRVGFSSYHFHRMFRKEVGINIADYVRRRRLCLAAQLLLNSSDTIIDIALHCQFESQESFTRAFKRLYGIPPGRYRKLFELHTDYHEQGGITMGESNTSTVKGWFISGSHPMDYEMGIERTIVHQGSTSGYLQALTPVNEGGFGTMMQQFKAEKFRGKRMRFSGFVRTENVKGYCGLWMRVDNQTDDMLQFDNMSNRPIVGNTNWNHYEVVLDVPEASAVISIGILLMGSGKVWVDSFQFEEVDRNTPVTNMDPTLEMLDEPTNLSFED